MYGPSGTGIQVATAVSLAADADGSASDRRLAHSGWYAVTVDLHGHGDSDWSPNGDYRFERHADDVRPEHPLDRGRPLVLASGPALHGPPGTRTSRVSTDSPRPGGCRPTGWRTPPAAGDRNDRCSAAVVEFLERDVRGH
jgi:hypothetical protein